MYIYFCEKCNSFEAFKSKTGSFKCPNCGVDFLPLGVTVDEWNNFSNDEMLETIDKARKPKVEIKKPVMPVTKPETAPRKPISKPKQEPEYDDEDFDYEDYREKPRGRNKLLIPIIIGVIAIVLAAGVILFFVLRDGDKTTSENVAETQEDQPVQPVSQKDKIDELYNYCIDIYGRGDTCASIVLDHWSTKTTAKSFWALWEEDTYRNINSYSITQEAKDRIKTFWDNKQVIEGLIISADRINKEINNVPQDEQAYYSAVKELFVMVSSYAKQSITFPDGYNEIGYGEFVRSNRQEFESLNSRVEIEKR